MLAVKSSLQLPLQLVEKAPVGSLGDELLRAGLHHADLVEPQRIEAHGVLGVVVAPLGVWEPTDRFERIVIALGVAPIDDESRCAPGVERAEVGRLQDRAYCSLRGHGMPSDELTVARDDATEVLRPRAVDGAIDDHVTDFFRPEFLRIGREPQIGVDLPLIEEPHRVGRRVCHEVDVAARIQTHVGRHTGDEHMLAAPQTEHAVFPLRSLMVRTRSLPNSSKHPGWTPASITVGSPASTWMRNGAAKAILMSASPALSALYTPAPPGSLRCRTSSNPSPLKSSAATYCGAAQRLVVLTSVSFLTSGGVSAPRYRARASMNPPAPAAPTVLRNTRRVIISSTPPSVH